MIMKKRIQYALAGLLMALIACDPIENRDDLGALVPKEQFKYTVTQDPQNDFIVHLKNETPNVLFSWDYAWGSTLDQDATVRMLVPGTYKIKITATTAGGLVFDEKQITVTKADPNAFQEPEWARLTNMAAGKTWVWDTGKPAAWGNGGYKGCVAPCWWAVSAADLAGRGVLNDEMTFDLNGGRNLTLKAASVPAAGTTKGSFNLDMTSKIAGWSVGKLTTTNVTVINGINVNDGNAKFTSYDILKITNDELHLAAAKAGTGDWGEAWFWLFKPKN
jgi:PKD repeat protein